MTKNLSNFIKYNIDIVDSENWELLFLRTLEELDGSEVIELINIIKDVLGYDTEAERKSVLYNEISNALSNTYFTTVSVRHLVSDFSNFLGFTFEQIVKFLEENSFNMNIHVYKDYTGHYVVERL